MIRKYESTAKENGCIMIPQCGIESAPPDLVTRVLVDTVRKKYSAPTGEVVVSLHEITSKPSGGTLATVLTLLDVYSLKDVRASMKPYALSPIPAPKIQDSATFFSSLLTKLFGIKVVPDLGILTTSIAGGTDLPIIHRSWGILGGADFYGPNFHVSEYMKTRNYLTAIAMHYGLLIGAMFLYIPLFRKVARNYVYQPGEGPTKDEYKGDRVEWRAIAKPDLGKPKTPRVFCRAHFEGSAYALTGILLAQGAMTILRDNHELSGGVYTPASLGQKFVDRLQEGGMRFEKKFYE
ncbi:hypothetical protein ACMFMG_008477 [Clarireedia jacksonii]